MVWDDAEGAYRTEMGEKVEEIEEANYLFKFRQEVLDEVEKWNEKATRPQYVKTVMKKSLEEINRELSISRPKSRISWGIEVPDDSD